jgi:hypothetical protein
MAAAGLAGLLLFTAGAKGCGTGGGNGHPRPDPGATAWHGKPVRGRPAWQGGVYPGGVTPRFGRGKPGPGWVHIGWTPDGTGVWLPLPGAK